MIKLIKHFFYIKRYYMRLLLADDEKELTNALVAILKHSNYTVDAVYNGTDALDYALGIEHDEVLALRLPYREAVKRREPVAEGHDGKERSIF